MTRRTIHLLLLIAPLLGAGSTSGQQTGAEGVPGSEKSGDVPPILEGTYGRFIARRPPGPLPEFWFFDDDGSSVTMQDFRGKLVLVNLWGTWCPPCVKEMPSLDRLQATFDRSEFEVVAICNECGEADSIKEFYGKHSLKHLSIYHRPGYDVAVALDVRGMPTSLLIDRTGQEMGRLAGDAEWDSPAALELVRFYLRAAQ